MKKEINYNIMGIIIGIIAFIELSFLLGIITLIFGIIAKKKNKKNAALVLGIINIVLLIILEDTFSAGFIGI